MFKSIAIAIGLSLLAVIVACISGVIAINADMAGAAIYLASRAGDYVVGATLVVDSGASDVRGRGPPFGVDLVT